ncbi:peptidase inhibitor family I36 protein [Streptomyces sp. EN23]|uniref:peptidase inhibitor family I36 protein n=1 Tax=Streptomyces sp. EN23 TaxID=212774 RepID=UPI00159EFBF9|nr:peptidase inhibitor family I36 protein [Streptomyces sp. EN23]
MGRSSLYRDDDFRGGQVSLTNSVTGITHLSNYGFNDEADSFYNNHNKDAAWYTDANYNGRRVCMHSLSSNRSFSFQDSDEASSTRKLSSATSC